MASQGSFFSIINIPLGQSAPSSIPEEFRDLIDNLIISIGILQQAFDTYCGVSGKQQLTWSKQDFRHTLLDKNLNRFYAQATENIVYGGLVALDPVGEMRVRNANATNNSRVTFAFCNVVGGVTAGQWGEFLLKGLCPIGGLTIGNAYWTGTVAGLASGARPVAAGNIEQFIGLAVANNLLWFNPGGYIQH